MQYVPRLATAWGFILGKMVQKATEKGILDKKIRIICSKMHAGGFYEVKHWRERKSTSRVHFGSISNFELLRQAFHEDGSQINISTGITRAEGFSKDGKDSDWPWYRKRRTTLITNILLYIHYILYFFSMIYVWKSNLLRMKLMLYFYLQYFKRVKHI